MFLIPFFAKGCRLWWFKTNPSGQLGAKRMYTYIIYIYMCVCVSIVSVIQNAT